MLKRGLFTCAVLGMATSAFAGARIDLRPVGFTPTPTGPGGIPQVTVDANTMLDVDVFLVDTGSPQGNIFFRGVFLDFTDTTASTAANFMWVNPGSLGTTFPALPLTSWVFPLGSPIDMFQIQLPNDGEVLLGDIQVNAGAAGGLLDVMNEDGQVGNPNLGAAATFGFGVNPNDPVTNWTAAAGDLTGGTLNIAIVPEPATLALLGVGAIAAFRRRRTA